LPLLRRLLPLFIPISVGAAEPVGTTVSAGTYVQTGLALAFIVALLMGAAWLARKVSGGKKFGQGDMKIIGGVALGPRERIVLIEVGDKWLVIGVVPGQIRTLHRMDKGAIMPANDPPSSAEKPFAHWLKGVTERRNHG
jgi:flagellar protein FliO/FliZ